MPETDASTRELLRDTATRLFQDLCEPEALRTAEGGHWLAAMWRAVEDAGLPKALVPEAAGGSGVSFADAMVIVRAAGWFALPLPLPETMLAGWLLARAGLPVPDGPMTVAYGDSITLTCNERGCYPRGQALRVPWARDHTTIVAMDNAGCVTIAPRDDCTIEPGENVAREPRNAVTLGGRTDQSGDARLDRLQLRAVGAALRAQQIAGALERVLDMTTQYAMERTQFGRPIGKFQAVQQNLAVLAGQTAAAGAAADIAAEAVDDTIRLLPIAAAKARCGEAAGIGAAIAHQVHGAIGFTHEHSLHFLTKRLWSWRDEFGNETEWNQLTGRHMAKAGPRRYWAEITAA
ncbi:MAG: acyl-CoA dehydrogenase family protein [Acetobacteraceae bacterium]